MFIGRQQEFNQLKQFYESKKSHIAVLYGRRRIGKSSLVEHFVHKVIKCPTFLSFEGIENLETHDQIKEFTRDLDQQIQDPLLKSVHFNGWDEIFRYLSIYFKKSSEKKIIFLDEFQWLAVGQSKLVALLKKYWDTEWSKSNVLLILCGSISSYMVKKVIHSKALYGRVHWECCLDPLAPSEASKMLGSKKSVEEKLKTLLILGGIPKYLESIQPNRSFEQNLNDLFFKQSSLFLTEYEKIFYSQFKEYRTYEKIIRFLATSPKTLQEISLYLKMTSGGGIRVYLDNLEKALFITSYSPYSKQGHTKLIKYKITDEYLRFYFKYIQPHLRLISKNKNRDLFTFLTKNSFEKWLGFAFEVFCTKNAMHLARSMGFEDKVLSYGPEFKRGQDGFQADLVFLRSDRTITLCEMKFYHCLVTTKIIPEVKKKCASLSIPRGFTLEKALISLHGPDQPLKDAEFFQHIVMGKDLLEV